MARTPRAPWKRQNPRKRAGKASKHLTSAQKSAAKTRARRAGRPYPNLVDNMRVATKKRAKAKTATKKKAAKRKASHKKSAKKGRKRTARKAAVRKPLRR